MGLGFFLFLISLIAIMPFILMVVITFLLWKFSFTAAVNGFFSFKDVMFKIPLSLDFSLMIRIEKVKFSFTFSSKILKIVTQGF